MSNMFIDLFDLRTDQADADVIDVSIRDNVKVAGTNLWVLIFAILIASVGLNVNSAAVIIGAMLISPLMGPIVGIGYGVGINDIDLIKLALRNLGVFTVISILASSLYFLLSPLNIAQSELLARTSPTIWDVMIAFFGGAAGIIASTRKSVSNVVPGVAIATALMPPLCTAGFGIAQGNWSYFGGAFFLYIINSVLIALATFMFVKIFHLPKHKYVDRLTEKRTHLFIFVMLVIVVVPSSVLGYNLVNQSRFTQTVNEFVNESYRDNSFILFGHEIHPQIEEVILTVGGTKNPNLLKNKFEKSLREKGFENAHVVIRYSGSSELDLGSLKTQLTQDLYNNMIQQVDELSKKNRALEDKLGESQEKLLSNKALFDELHIQYEAITRVSISRGEQYILMKEPVQIVNPVANPQEQNTAFGDAVDDDIETQANTSRAGSRRNADGSFDAQGLLDESNLNLVTSANTIKKSILLLVIESKELLSTADKDRIISWLNVKYSNEYVEVRFELAATESSE